MYQQHPKRRQRRHHSAQFKVQLVDHSVKDEASVSATAIATRYIPVEQPALPAAMVNPALHDKAQVSAQDQITQIEFGRNAVRICLDWPVAHEVAVLKRLGFGKNTGHRPPQGSLLEEEQDEDIATIESEPVSGADRLPRHACPPT